MLSCVHVARLSNARDVRTRLSTSAGACYTEKEEEEDEEEEKEEVEEKKV